MTREAPSEYEAEGRSECRPSVRTIAPQQGVALHPQGRCPFDPTSATALDP